MSLFRSAKGLCSKPVVVFCRPWVRHVCIIPWTSLEAPKDWGKDTISITAAAFEGCPLIQITPQRRGIVLETVARRSFAKIHPGYLVEDPIPGERCDGKMRALHCAEYDWLFDGRRVQCKSAQMCWRASHSLWRIHFCGIHLRSFDDLVLVVYSPSGLHLFTHDGMSRLSNRGVFTAHAGLALSVDSAKGLLDWREAEGVILKKLQQSGQYVTWLKTSNELVGEVLQRHTEQIALKLQRDAFAQHPLNHMTPTARGLVFQRVVQEVDLLSHPGCLFTGSTAHSSPCDWHRDGLRVECKSSRLTWSRGSWRCNFDGVKFGKFDCLYLALDSPDALHIFRFAGSKWISSNGLREQAKGKRIRVYGPARETNAFVAIDVITQKLLSSGSEHVASVVW